MSQPTLLDIAKRNSADSAVGLIEEAFLAHPEVMLGAARSIRGLNYQTLVRTTLPTVAFRNANEGSAVVASKYDNRLISTYILNPQWQCDRAVADRSEDGAQAYIADEAAGLTEAAMQTLATQFYYGVTAGDAKGFPGLLSQLDATNMEVDAAGDASDCSSVWAVRFGPQDVQWVLGNNGMLDVPETTVQRVVDGNGKPYSAYCGELLAYVGLAIHRTKAIGRIRDVDAGKPLTDDMISALLNKFPAGRPPTVIFMSRRSNGYLQQSRTATTTTGAPAPFPQDVFGIPIAVTDAILDTETAV